jgi:DNA-binding Xre family transcriptional regulator
LRGLLKNATVGLHMADGTTTTKRNRAKPPGRPGAPQGRRKGYTRGKQGDPKQTADRARKRAAMLAKKPKHTKLHGIVGKVPKLYLLIDRRLEDLDWNWSRLADEIPCSRQYLIDTTDKETIPADFFYRICQVLTLKPHDLIKTADD